MCPSGQGCGHAAAAGGCGQLGDGPRPTAIGPPPTCPQPPWTSLRPPASSLPTAAWTTPPTSGLRPPAAAVAHMPTTSAETMVLVIFFYCFPFGKVVFKLPLSGIQTESFSAPGFRNRFLASPIRPQRVSCKGFQPFRGVESPTQTSGAPYFPRVENVVWRQFLAALKRLQPRSRGLVRGQASQVQCTATG